MRVSKRTIMASALSVLTITVFTPVVSSGATGDVKVFEAPTSNSYPESVTVGFDGTVWFTEKQGNRIGRLSRSGQITELSIPTTNSRPQGIVAGPDGDVWFTESNGNRIGRIAPSGKVTEYPLSDARSDAPPFSRELMAARKLSLGSQGQPRWRPLVTALPNSSGHCSV